MGKKKGHVLENSVIVGKVTHKLVSGTPIDSSRDARGPRRAISKRAEPTGCLLVLWAAGVGCTSRPGRVLTPISQPRTLRLGAASGWSRPWAPPGRGRSSAVHSLRLSSQSRASAVGQACGLFQSRDPFHVPAEHPLQNVLAQPAFQNNGDNENTTEEVLVLRFLYQTQNGRSCDTKSLPQLNPFQ